MIVNLPPLLLLALPCTLAFLQPPPAALSTLGRTGAAARHGSFAATWPATGGGGGCSGSAVTMAAVGRRQGTILFGKNRKRRKGTNASQDSPSWFDDDDEIEEGGGDGATASAAAAAAGGSAAATGGPFSTTAATEKGASTAPPPPPTAVADFTNSNTGGSSSITDDDDEALLPNLDDLDDDGNQIVLEPVWVEGETHGEKPIVETYGLNDALATAQDGIDIDNGMMIDPDEEELLIPAADGALLPGGLANGVGPESWRNGMEVPDDDVMLGERFNMVGRGLDDMLMERSIRFYDPKVCVVSYRCCALTAADYPCGLLYLFHRPL